MPFPTFRFSTDDRDSYRMMLRLQLLLACGCFFILMYALQFHSFWVWLQVMAGGLLMAGAALLLGFLGGFIFCIPRTPKLPPAPSPSGGNGQTGAGAAAQDDNDAVEPNSNLVDISDWLTKILVGVGLVELNKIPHALRQLCVTVAPAIRASNTPTVDASEAVCLGILLYFSAAGFLIGYLWTRLYFQKALASLAHKATQVDKFWQNVDGAANALLQSRPHDALALINRALSFDDQNPRALFEKGRILKALAQAGGAPGDQNLLMQALQAVSSAVSQSPTTSSFLYNKACYEALLSRPVKETLDDLAKAIQLAPVYKQYAQGDPDFASLKSDTDFQKLIQ